MAAAADRCTRPANLRFAAALLLAAVLHTAVLWLPVVHDVKPNRILHRLTVSLQHTRMRQEAFIAAEQQPQPAPAAIPDRQGGPVAGETPSSGTALPDMRAPPPEPLTFPSTARLLDLAGQREWNLVRPSESIRLGEPRSQAIPEDPPPGIRPQPNRFARAFEREKVEVVDRWLAADGSHNVVVTSPSGESYCGRAEAAPLLNPLIEPIMMWRPCGGGGKRTFDWPDRYRKTATGSDLP